MPLKRTNTRVTQWPTRCLETSSASPIGTEANGTDRPSTANRRFRHNTPNTATSDTPRSARAHPQLLQRSRRPHACRRPFVDATLKLVNLHRWIPSRHVSASPAAFPLDRQGPSCRTKNHPRITRAFLQGIVPRSGCVFPGVGTPTPNNSTTPVHQDAPFLRCVRRTVPGTSSRTARKGENVTSPRPVCSSGVRRNPANSPSASSPQAFALLLLLLLLHNLLLHGEAGTRHRR